ncbi:hypothetical protein C8R44DRAFT_894584 [Mycena epipterygia]|nr:hypothetical protein C8R44DRAFT_894584 [Mycena epipterygia]
MLCLSSQSQNFYSRSRELASLPIRRPRRFWDFHIPMATWDYKGRISHPPQKTTRLNERDTAACEWVSIPDANLPGPWTCDWASWPWWKNATALEAALAVQYAISNAPLTPIVFSSFDGSTVFACAPTRRFYLYYPPCIWEPRPDETMYAFEGVFSSVDTFIEEADWNRVEKVERACEVDPVTLPTVRPGSTTLPLISGKGFRVAATEQYPRRTLWDMFPPLGTFMYQPRWYCEKPHATLDELEIESRHRVREWPRIPDAQLPAPWSCDWTQMVEGSKWYDKTQGEAVRYYGSALGGFVPALFHPLGNLGWREDIVLSPPGGAGTYYLWWNECRRDWGPWNGEMERFEGVYASVEHFIRTADWNRLEWVPWIPHEDQLPNPHC